MKIRCRGLRFNGTVFYDKDFLSLNIKNIKIKFELNFDALWNDSTVCNGKVN